MTLGLGKLACKVVSVLHLHTHLITTPQKSKPSSPVCMGDVGALEALPAVGTVRRYEDPTRRLVRSGIGFSRSGPPSFAVGLHHANHRVRASVCACECVCLRGAVGSG